MSDVLTYKLLTVGSEFCEDARLTDFEARILLCLHVEADVTGSLTVNQGELAKRLNRTREAVNRAIGRICRFGYVERDFSRAPITMIYVMLTDSGIVKVGISDKPESRRKRLEESGPFVLTVAHQEPIPSDVAALVEARAHAILDRHRVRREWFAVSVDVAKAAIAQAVKELAARLEWEQEAAGL